MVYFLKIIAIYFFSECKSHMCYLQMCWEPEKKKEIKITYYLITQI